MLRQMALDLSRSIKWIKFFDAYIEPRRKSNIYNYGHNFPFR